MRAPTAAFALAAVEVPGPGSGAMQRLAATRGQVQETFTAAAGTALHALPVRALGTQRRGPRLPAPLPAAPGARGDRATRGGDRDDAVAGGDGGAGRHGVGRGRWGRAPLSGGPGEHRGAVPRAAPGRRHGPGGRSGRGPARAPARRGLCAADQWRHRAGPGRRVPDGQCPGSGLSLA